MTHVIAEPCIGTKDQACAKVCPVDCIHPLEADESFASAEQLYIDPEKCINCLLCVPECPVEAIFKDDDVPEKWAHFKQINAEWYIAHR
jgi:ferredoxin